MGQTLWSARNALVPLALALTLIACGDTFPDGAVELHALKLIRTVQDAEYSYYQSHGAHATLSELSSSEAQPIPTDLASGFSGEYHFRVEITAEGYSIYAHTDTPGAARPRRSFYGDETGVIRASHGPEPATRTSKRIDGEPEAGR